MATGKVKWFNNAKGYGFILPEEGGEDLFAHYSSIEMDGYKTLKAGQDVLFEIVEGPKGYHAVNIRCATEAGDETTVAQEIGDETVAEEEIGNEAAADLGVSVDFGEESEQPPETESASSEAASEVVPEPADQQISEQAPETESGVAS